VLWKEKGSQCAGRWSCDFICTVQKNWLKGKAEVSRKKVGPKTILKTRVRSGRKEKKRNQEWKKAGKWLVKVSRLTESRNRNRNANSRSFKSGEGRQGGSDRYRYVPRGVKGSPVLEPFRVESGAKRRKAGGRKNTCWGPHNDTWGLLGGLKKRMLEGGRDRGLAITSTLVIASPRRK